MKRREFFAAAAAVGAVAATSSTLSAQAPPTGGTARGPGGRQAGAARFPGDRRAQAQLRFCRVVGRDISSEELNWMKSVGFDAVEVGDPGNVESATRLRRRVEDAGLIVASMYMGGPEHPLMSEDRAERQRGLDEAKAKMETAQAAGIYSIVYVPVRGGQPEAVRNLPERVLWERTVRVLRDLGPIAVAHNTNVVLEPLRRGEAWFMRQVTQAVRLCQEANVPGIAALGDTYHMYTEDANSMAAFMSGGDYIKHVHIGSGQGRQLPNAENHSAPGHTHTEVFRGLKYIGYTGVCSFECGVGGSGDLRVEMPKCLDYLRQCWEEA